MKRNIWGVMIDDAKREDLIREISQRLEQNQRTTIFTPNSIMVQNAKKDSRFMAVLNSADYNVPDGNGILLAAKLFSSHLSERICGIDLAEDVAHEAALKQLKIFLFGGRENVAVLAAASLTKRYPTLKICGTLNGFQTDNDLCIENIKNSNADILYVCLGSPKQELWIYENAHKLPHVKLFIGLGGSLDTWSGNSKRAPYVFRKCGFEWLWRMSMSPRRLKELPKLLGFGFSTVFKALRSIVIMHR